MVVRLYSEWPKISQKKQTFQKFQKSKSSVTLASPAVRNRTARPRPRMAFFVPSELDIFLSDFYSNFSYFFVLLWLWKLVNWAAGWNRSKEWKHVTGPLIGQAAPTVGVVTSYSGPPHFQHWRNRDQRRKIVRMRKFLFCSRSLTSKVWSINWLARKYLRNWLLLDFHF